MMKVVQETPSAKLELVKRKLKTTQWYLNKCKREKEDLQYEVLRLKAKVAALQSQLVEQPATENKA